MARPRSDLRLDNRCRTNHPTQLVISQKMDYVNWSFGFSRGVVGFRLDTITSGSTFVRSVVGRSSMRTPDRGRLADDRKRANFDHERVQRDPSAVDPADLMDPVS
jgi:hypothetical protein